VIATKVALLLAFRHEEDHVILIPIRFAYAVTICIPKASTDNEKAVSGASTK
jgi:hypothetical protein